MFTAPRLGGLLRRLGLAVAGSLGLLNSAQAQIVAPMEKPLVLSAAESTLAGQPIQQANWSTGCATGNCGAVGCSSCGNEGCGEGGCYPGREGCNAMVPQTRFGRFYAAFQNAVCCPDPCYIPRWNDIGNAALFVDAVRPGTYTRIRWDSGRGMVNPDRAEYFWARAGVGPAAETKVNWDQISLYTEVGTEKFSFFVDLPYRSVDPQVNARAGGFGEIRLGTKSVLLDSEILLTTFQFTTSIPISGPSTGVSNGHVSLEPALLTSVKLRENTYLQSKTAYWFGVGNSNGSAVVWQNSINQLLCKPTAESNLIGSFETNGYTFTSGNFTTPGGAVLGASGVTYFTLGPSLRWTICNKVDFGFGVQFAVTDKHFAEQQYRTELRWRF